jgi:hypothetical protein
MYVVGFQKLQRVNSCCKLQKPAGSSTLSLLLQSVYAASVPAVHHHPLVPAERPLKLHVLDNLRNRLLKQLCSVRVPNVAAAAFLL